MSLIPKNRFGDKIFSLINFVTHHRRLPTKNLIFNDVLYQIKITDELLDPLRVFTSDKEFVKIYVKALLDDKYNVPTIAILENENQIDSFDFPDACCIKATHASGLGIIRKNGEDLNRDEIKSWFSINYYHSGREVNYKLLKPKVIVEPLVFDNTNVEDYKIHCYKGNPRFIQVDIDRFTNHTRQFYNTAWEALDFELLFPKSAKKIVRPNNLDEMLLVSRALSKHFSLIRVDLYSNGSQSFVGELTNLHGNACENFGSSAEEKEASKLLFGISER
jgi:hypothetical protein